MSYLVRFVNTALSSLEENHIEEKPTALVLDIGELTGLLPEYLTRYYPAATRNTALFGSTLVINELPAEAECDDCKTRYRPTRECDYRCPACKSLKARFLHGREASVKEIRF